MHASSGSDSVSPPGSSHYDVVIVGAGLSGVGAAYYLQQRCPHLTFVILEAQDHYGGTWFSHRYPGVRSDTDRYTYGFSFKPWAGPPIARGEEILTYLGEFISEHDLDRHVHYRQKVLAANWSSDAKHWTIRIGDPDQARTCTISAGFIWMCPGYYRHREGYTPDWDGLATFKGRIVHPANWPEDLDLRDKRVVVVGSGATAATLVPAIAEECRHVTMLQRSPTFYGTAFSGAALADELSSLQVDPAWFYEIIRRKVFKEKDAFIKRTFTNPEGARKDLIAGVRSQLPPDFDIEKHFAPAYRPWQQRICLVPNGDFFAAIRSGKASVVTDKIVRFIDRGIVLDSGAVLEADIVVTATGFNLSILGDIELARDGVALDLSDTVTYRGMMFTGVPNLCWVFGYYRNSWTPRVEIVGEFVCRLLNYMSAGGFKSVRPELRSEEQDMAIGPWTDPQDFNPSYLTRSLDRLPKAGNKPEWRHAQNHMVEQEQFAAIDLAHDALVFTS